MNKETRPMLNIDGQIAHLIKTGVKFELISIDEAKTYLQQNNNYFKLRAYRKNFDKHPDGENKGKYINLDFAMLKDLAVIDMRLRYLFMHMTLDIEHFVKVKLIYTLEQYGDDGYSLVASYIEHLRQIEISDTRKPYTILMNELNKCENSPYCKGIISTYKNDYPIWAFVEVLSFGGLVHLYQYCAKLFDSKEMKSEMFRLFDVKEIRNAAAHSNCIINELGNKDNCRKSSYDLTNALSSFSKTYRSARLSNERIRQIATLLYTHSHIISSTGVLQHTKQELTNVITRMNRNIIYYENNDLILTNFDFFEKLVDIFY